MASARGGQVKRARADAISDPTAIRIPARDRDGAVFLKLDGGFNIHEAPLPVGERIFTAVWLLIVLPFAAFAVGFSTWICWTALSSPGGIEWWILLLGLFFLLASAPSVAMVMLLQGYLFPRSVSVSGNFYCLRNGLVRLRLRLRHAPVRVTIHVFESRGDWRASASLRRHGGRLPLPLMRSTMFGSKRRAIREANVLEAWLKEARIVDVVTTKVGKGPKKI